MSDYNSANPAFEYHSGRLVEELRSQLAAATKRAEEAERERDEALSDNAALLKVFGDVAVPVEAMNIECSQAPGFYSDEMRHAITLIVPQLREVIRREHPGAAILAALEALRRRAGDAEAARDTIDGDRVKEIMGYEDMHSKFINRIAALETTIAGLHKEIGGRHEFKCDKCGRKVYGEPGQKITCNVCVWYDRDKEFEELQATIAGLEAQKAGLKGKLDSVTAQYQEIYQLFQNQAVILDELTHGI